MRYAFFSRLDGPMDALYLIRKHTSMVEFHGESDSPDMEYVEVCGIS